MTRKYHRIARLLEIITLVRGNEKLKPKDIADYFEISLKRVYDDITDLNMAGIPIVFSGEGYKILQGFFLPQFNFSLEEVFMALLSFKLAGKETFSREYHQVLDKMAQKFMEGLSPQGRSMFSRANRRIQGDGKQRTRDLNPRVLTQLCQGIAESTKVEMIYKNPGAPQPSRRMVDPYSLVYRRNSWYLVGYCHLRKEVRTFKVVRVEQAWNTLKGFEMPENFNVNTYLGDSWWVTRGEPADVEIRFDKVVAPLIMEKEFPHARISPHKNGSITFRTRVSGLDEITWWTLQYGEHAEVIAPCAMRDRMKGIFKKALAIYERKK